MQALLQLAARNKHTSTSGLLLCGLECARVLWPAYSHKITACQHICIGYGLIAAGDMGKPKPTEPKETCTTETAQKQKTAT